MKLFFIVLVTYVLLFLTGCSSNKLIRLEDDQNCATIIEGYYSNPKIWNNYYPAFVLKNGKFRLAKEIKRDSIGIFFLEKKTRIFQTPDTLFFPFSEIQTVIDSTRLCTYGEIIDRHAFKDIKLTLHLAYDNDTTYKPIFLELEPNEKFSYCVKPGNYTIKGIVVNNNGRLDGSLGIPKIKFNVESNKTNYIGSISLANNLSDSNNCIVVPYKCFYDSKKSAAVGFMFGLIGTIVYESTKSYNDEADGIYLIKINNDENFKYISNREKVINLIQ